MYPIRESNYLKNKINEFLKSTNLPYYDEKYIQTFNNNLNEIDFVLNINNYNVCISIKFIYPAPSSLTITKFISNINLIKQLTNKETYGILLLKSDISSDSVFQLKICPIHVQILQNNDKEVLYKIFMKYMYSNSIFIIDSDNDTVMIES